MIVQETVPPSLSIVREGDQVIISWTDPAARYELQSTTSLEQPVLGSSTVTIHVPTGNGYSATFNIEEATRFYRLFLP